MVKLPKTEDDLSSAPRVAFKVRRPAADVKPRGGADSRALTGGEHHQLVIPSLGESSFKSHSQSELFSGNGMFAARV